MKGSRTKDKLKVQVIEAKLNAPDMKLREIAQTTWLPTSTVSDIIQKDLPEVRKGSARLQEIVETNNNIISIWKKLIETYLPALEISKHNDLKTISDILDTALKQNQLLTGNATDRSEIVLETLSEEQKRLIARRYQS